MNKFQSHCSGHARGTDLLEVVREIDTKIVYLIHTEHPAIYKKVSQNVTVVEESMSYKI